jgi:hypothetical protein
VNEHHTGPGTQFEVERFNVAPDAESSGLLKRRNRLLWVVLIIFLVAELPALVTTIIVLYFNDQPWASAVVEFGYQNYVLLFTVGFLGFIVAIPFALNAIRVHLHLENLRLQITGLRADLPRDLEGILVEINLKYLDQYYLETRIQASRSFSASLLVGVAGFVIIAISLLMFYQRWLTEAMVTLAAGTIIEFISAVFFYLFNKTVLSMASYHQRLVFTQNIALAINIAKSAPEQERAKMFELVLNALLSDINQHLAGPTTRA